MLPNKSHTITICILLVAKLLLAQDTAFTFNQDVSSKLADLGASNGDWVDVDGDGDLDIFLSGLYKDEESTYLYRNEANDSTSIIETTIDPLLYHTSSWGDFDNDNDMDLLYAGAELDKDSLIPYCRLYKNLGEGDLILTEAAIPGIFRGTLSWSDYDNDGDSDIFIAGAYAQDDEGVTVLASSRILRNDGDLVFTDIGANIPGIYDSQGIWGDYDNDLDMDLLVTGFFKDEFNTGQRYTKLFRNDGNDQFVKVDNAFPPLKYGNIAWADYDSDGDLDLLLNGDPASPTFLIYIFENVGGGNFQETGIEIIGTIKGSIDWSDYDNDGDLDFLLSGLQVTPLNIPILKLYKNSGSGLFSEDYTAYLPPILNGSAKFGDYNNDNKQDILVTGYLDIDETAGYSAIFMNNLMQDNQAPLAPPFSEASTIDEITTLTWVQGNDEETPVDGLSYNIRIGSDPGLGDVYTGQSLPDGSKLLADIGNAGHNTSWKVTGLTEGTYYWAVQAIDGSKTDSQFSDESSFTILETGTGTEFTESNHLGIYPNPATNIIRLEFSLSYNDVEIQMVNTSGQVCSRWHPGNIITGDTKTMNVEHLPSGQYFIRLFESKKVITTQAVIIR